MTSIGETLRRERVRRNLALDQISRELKISAKMLEAIEAEEFDKLPGTIFAKNFVRQYAHILGLDEEEMAAEVQRTLQPTPVEPPRFAGTSRAALPPIHVTPIQLPKVEDWHTAGDRGFSWTSPLPALALFVVAMLVCSGVYAWYQRTRRPVLAQGTAATQPAPVPQSAPPAAQQQPPQAQPSGAIPPVPTTGTQPAAQAQTSPQPNGSAQTAAPASATPPAAAPGTTPPPANPDVTVRVQITAEEPSWVLVAVGWQVSLFGDTRSQSDPHGGGQ